MSKTQKIILAISVAISLVVVGSALLIANNKQDDKQSAAAIAQRPVSASELAKADGKDGRDCYAAIDGTVYLIKDFSLWQNGKHTPSKNMAYCGADLSKVIDKSPHGRKILDILTKVGPLTP